MSSRILDVAEALVTLFAGIDGSAPFYWDLSGEDQVGIGDVPDALAPLPLVRLLPEMELETVFGDTLTDQRTTARIAFLGLAPVDDEFQVDAIRSAARLLADIEDRIRRVGNNNMQLGGLARSIIVSRAALLGGAVEGGGDVGIVDGEITVEFVVRRGP